MKKCMLKRFLVNSALLLVILFSVVNVFAAPTKITFAENTPQVVNANVLQGTSSHILCSISATINQASDNFTNISFTAFGTFTSSDVTNFKLWYNSSDDLGTATLESTNSTITGAGGYSFSLISIPIVNPNTVYIWITADVDPSATVGNTFGISNITQANFTFSTGSNNFTGNDSGTQTIVAPCLAPTTQASGVSFSSVTSNSMTVSWTRGGTPGDNVIVLAKEGSAVDADPVDGTTYSASSIFASGSQIGTGNYVIYIGTGTSVGVTSLNSSTTYHYAVYEFNDCSGNEQYYTTSPGTGNQATSSPPAACATELIISEYYEGASNDKYIEIYNGTAASVNLANYKLSVYTNGSTTATDITLSGTISSLSTYIVANTSANATILASANATSGSISFNGNDAVALRTTANVLVDVIGQIGYDPTTEWGTGLTSTLDNMLIRKASINAGDANGSDAFDPATEWNGYANGDFSYMGTHTMTCVSTDNDSEASSPTGGQQAGGTISSLADTDPEAVNVFKFDIDDLGSGDLLATKVTNIRIIPAVSNTADWTDHIQGLKLDNSGAVTIGSPTITDTYIDIPITAGNLDIADNSSSTITMSIYLNTSNIVDGAVLSFMIDADLHGWTADVSGSAFAGTFTGGDVVSNNFTVTVVATQLIFTSATPPATGAPGSDFSVEVSATDANGNIDTDATNSVTLNGETGSGTLTSVTGLTQSLSSGVYLWTDCQFDIADTYQITATTTGLADNNVTSGDIVIAITADYIIISEMCDPANNFNNDRYIEIYNPTGSTIDLTGCKVEAIGNAAVIFTWNLSGTIGSCTALTCGDAASTVTHDFTSATWTTSNTTWNGGATDGARFKNSSGTIIDNATSTTVFSDGALTRNSTINTPNTSFTSGEWTMNSVSDAGSGSSTPGIHVNDGCSGPTITTSETTLTAFWYEFGSGPSASQSYTISAINLVGSGNITVSGSTNYEVSTDDASFSGSVLLPFASGVITSQPVTIYVRLKSGLAVGAYDGEIVSNAGGGATTVNITCDGDVTEPANTYISEVASYGLTPGTFDNEYIELVNDNATPQSLDGWQLLYYGSALEKTITFGASDIIPANDAFVIAVRTSYTGALTPDYVPATSFSLNENGYVVLKDNFGNIQDEAGALDDKFTKDFNYEFTDCGNDNKPTANWTDYGTVDGTPGVVTCIACVTPTVASSSIVFSSVTGSSIDLTWTNGNGAKRIVIASEGAPVSFTPVDGTTYIPNSVFSDGTDLGSGNVCVFNGLGNSVSVTGLTGSTVYYFSIFEYNCSPGSELYYSTSCDDNQATDLAPVTGLHIVCQTNTTVELEWINPTGDYTGVIIGARNSALTPHNVSGDATTYVADPVFMSGYQYGSTTPYSFVVYNGAGTTVTVTGLTAGQVYTFEAYAYKNNTASIWASTTPTTSVSSLGTVNVTGQTVLVDNTQLQLQWTAPAAACYDEVMIVGIAGAAITTIPTGDGTGYAADLAYGSGDSYDGGFIVYKGTASPQMVTGLTNGVEYCFTWFVRNGTSWSSGVSACGTPANITILYPGDLAIIAVNTQMGAGSADEICFFSFQDITTGTSIDFTDNGYERVYPLKWADSEGTIRLTRTGATIPAGQTICFQGYGNGGTIGGFDLFTCGTPDNAGWTVSSLNSIGEYDLNVDDQIWIMQGGAWDYNGALYDHDAVYSGNILYGWTATGWKPTYNYNSTKGSTIFPGMECFNTDVTVSADHDKVKYIGDMSVKSQYEWLTYINDDANWTGYANNGLYEAGPDYVGSCITFDNNDLIIPGSAGVWTGAASSDWFDCLNWENLRIPHAGVNVLVSGQCGNHITIDDGIPSVPEAECNDFTVASDATYGPVTDIILSVNNASSVFNVYGNFENNKVMSHTFGNINLVGTSPQTMTTSTSADDFLNLGISNASTGVTLNNDITVTNSLTLTDGVVSTGANKIVVSNTSSTAISGYSSASYIYGNLRRYLANNTDTYPLPVGHGTSTSDYHPADIINNNLAGVTYLDASVAAITEAGNNIDSRVATSQGTIDLNAIDESAEWSLIPDAVPSGGSYGVKLYVINTGLLTGDDNQFFAVKRTDASTDYANWDSFEGSTAVPADDAAGRIVDSGNGYAMRTGYTSFSKHAIGKGTVVLPIKLGTFTANLLMDEVEIRWTTNTEINNDFFTVEKTKDGILFTEVDRVPGAGFSNETIKYMTYDENPFDGTSYYRLKQTDYDGSSTYSKLVPISNTHYEGLEIVNMSSADNGLVLSIKNPEQKQLNVVISDMLGRQIYSNSVTNTTENFLLRVEQSGLSSGIYNVVIYNSKEAVTEKFYIK